MPSKIVQPFMFSPAQLAMRARLVAMNPTQFVALKAVLDQASGAIDVHISQLDAERTQLAAPKKKLLAVVMQLAKPGSLDALRTAVSLGHVSKAPIDQVGEKVRQLRRSRPNPKSRAANAHAHRRLNR